MFSLIMFKLYIKYFNNVLETKKNGKKYQYILQF